ncbi:unnamed protein product, partial [Mesorhabditis belari]|uniref:Acid phosphatase n=1 Tax=Mesorhabditis belari TaxID=2138241 RepID=A0AAF3EQS4_9BILA
MFRRNSILLIFLINATFCAQKLLNVNVIYRHGDRTPISTAPTDPYQEDFWGLPWGTLTVTGMQQQYANGLKLKARYIDQLKLVNATYSPYETYVKSAQTDRCIQSAGANMAAFYSDSTFRPIDPNWPNNYTPMPIHLNPAPDREYEPGKGCDKVEELYVERTAANPTFVAYELSHAKLFQTWEQNTNLGILQIKDFFDYFDTVVCEKDHNLTLPAWVTPAIFKEAEDVKSQTLDYLDGMAGFGKPDDIQMIRLRGGPLMKTIQSTWIENSQYKFYVHSAHDTTVDAMLYVLAAKTTALGKIQPDYAATLIFETWKMDDGSLAIQVLFSTNAYDNLHIITSAVSGCPVGDFCPVTQFLNRNNPYIPDDIQKECQK